MPEQLIIEKILVAPHLLPCDSARLFAYFGQKPWSMLLDSANCNHPDSRFDILVADPIATLVTYGKTTTITDQHGCRDSADDPLTLVHQQLRIGLSLTENPTVLPFIGGALGYWGYDLGGRFEHLPHLATDDLQTPDMAVGIYDWALIKDNHEQGLWFVSQQKHFAQTLPELHRFLTQSEPQQKSLLEPTSAAFVTTSAWQANMNFAQYREKFNQVQRYLLNGDCYQINLAQRFSASYQGDEYLAYLALAHHNQAPFSAFLRFETFAILSISPERLLQLEKRQIQSKPIKGTAPRATDPLLDQRNAQTLRASEKNQAENVMIVDLLRNDIGKVSVAGSVKVPSLFAIESFPAVHHLVSTVIGELEPHYHATDLLRSAFPGGSITGAPKIRAMAIIDELEPNRRSAYCGSIGYICASGNMDTNIAIRTLVCQAGQIHCWAGGGLVADSTVDSEYQETYDKVNKILPILSDLKP